MWRMVQLAYSTPMSRKTYLEEFFLGFGMVCRYEYAEGSPVAKEPT